MVKYICPRCCYDTDLKNNIVRHINRKKICNLIDLDVDPKKFSDIILQVDGVSISIIRRIIDLETENEKLKEKTKKLESQIQNIHIVGNNNNNNNCTINNNNNITILMAFDKNQVYDFLTDDDYIKSIRRMKYSVIELLKKTHFNKDHPEYKNINISNIKSTLANYWNGNKWNVIRQKKLIDELFESHEQMIQEWGDNNEEHYKKYYENVQKIINMYNQHEVVDNIKDEMKMLLYNERRI